MATAPYELTDKSPEDWPSDNGPSIDPQYIADRERDIRLTCLHTAIQLYRPGDADAEVILRTAEVFHNFVNGINLPAPVQS